MQVPTHFAKELPPADSATPAAVVCPKKRLDVSVRAIGCEMVVLDRRNELVHQLNPTASYIWERCDGRSTVAEIIRQLTESFEVDPKTAARDVTAIISQLEELNLLEPCSGAGLSLDSQPKRKRGNCDERE